MTPALFQRIGQSIALGLLAALQLSEVALAQAPGTVGAAWRINGNGFEGDLLITQSADGRLTGTVYGQALEGYYAPGAGTLIFLRYQANKPYQVFVGTASPQGLRGEFYPFAPDGGATPGRLRYDWSAAPAQAFIAAAPRQAAVALLPSVQPAAPIPAQVPAPTPASQPLNISGWTLVRAPTVDINAMTQGSVVAPCPAGKVATGFANSGNNMGAGVYVIERAPLPDGSGVRFTAFNGVVLGQRVSLAGSNSDAVCIDRPDGYRIVEANRSLGAGQVAAIEASCGAGEVVLGGGTRTGQAVYTAASAPRADGNAWQAYFRNDLKLPGAELAQVFAVCASNRYASARQVLATPATQLGRGGMMRNLKISCAGMRGLSAGYFSDVTTIQEGGVSFLTNPNPPILPNTWVAWGISNVDSDQANVGVRAICANIR